MTDIVDNTAAHRFELAVDGHTAELRYHVDDGRLVLDHTAVPDELSGQGLGGRLVRAALDRARKDDLVVVPVCGFARKWIETHPDAVDGATVA